MENGSFKRRSRLQFPRKWNCGPPICQYSMIKHISRSKKCVPLLYPSFKEYTVFLGYMKLSDVIHVRILCHLLFPSASLRPQTSQTPGPHFSHPGKLSWRRGKGNCWSVPINSYKHKGILLSHLFCRSWSLLQFLILNVLFQICITLIPGGWKSNSIFLDPSAFVLSWMCEHNLMTSIYH